MPIFSAKKYDPAFTYYTTKKHAERTDQQKDKTRFLRNENDDLVYAKKIINNSFSRSISTNMPPTISTIMEAYIRLSPDLKSVFDPRERYCLPENNPDFVTRTCKNTGKYIKVGSILLEKYLDFLENESESQYKELNRLVFRL